MFCILCWNSTYPRPPGSSDTWHNSPLITSAWEINFNIFLMLITKHFTHSQIHVDGLFFFILDTTGFILQFDFNQCLPQLWVARDNVISSSGVTSSFTNSGQGIYILLHLCSHPVKGDYNIKFCPVFQHVKRKGGMRYNGSRSALSISIHL